ncbi:alpha-ketoacid dehydrogenase kinase N-terminal domain-containing protein [Artomyces pyxidatus]|uniref:Alpha-ketoacid dehydrogenase kinase N-terminal domain-containing protein n=1 Tax=Artomyces pyxidatus TaxID=48021 RepID=A0ACB8TCP4_9AGAM|nr:alpha-ketoacid dehydrogenase kinase N-terminal domain-containing protein [Artomyces pyxidatus]
MQLSPRSLLVNRTRGSVRLQSTALHFYQNRQLELYAAKEAQRLTLRQLVFFGRSMNAQRLITSANYVRTELPVRIAHRLRDMQALPYVVVMQEGVAKVYELYWSAFEKFRRYPQIDTLEDNEAFCSFLRAILDDHASVIPNLSLGLSLASPHLPPDQLDSFMRRMLVSRISRRVLAEHHIALSDSVAGRDRDTDGDGHVGIIYTGLSVEKSVRRCTALLRELTYDSEHTSPQKGDDARWPEVIIEGHLDTKFAYIREHLEYIIFELLKNSMQATVAKHSGAAQLPPILVTIVAGVDNISMRISDQGGGLLTPQIKSPSDLFSFSHLRNATRLEHSRLGSLRTAVSNPAGMRATVEELVDRWQQEQRQVPDPQVEAGVGRHPRLGIGLAMSNIFARYCGGSLELVSIDGWGMD